MEISLNGPGNEFTNLSSYKEAQEITSVIRPTAVCKYMTQTAAIITQ